MQEKIFITGASGFLGSSILSLSLKEGFKVKCLEYNTKISNHLLNNNLEIIKGDIRKPESFEEKIKDCSTIIHAAAKIIGNTELDEVNSQSTLKLFKVANKLNIKKFIFISTRGTMGIENNVRDSNENSSNFSNHRFLDTYIKSKIEAEKMIINELDKSKVSLLILCPTAMIGPSDFQPTPVGKIIEYFIKQRLRFYIEGQINLIDVRDVAKVCVKQINSNLTFGKYGLGGKNIKISKLIKLIDSITEKNNIKFEIKYWIIILLSSFLNIFGLNHILGELVNKKRITRLRNGFSCFDSRKGIDEIGLNVRNLEETLYDIIKSKY